MKAYIGPYTNYISPYDIAKRILFWKDPYDDEEGKAIDSLGDWLRGKKGDKPSLTSRFCNWYNSRQKRTVAITIDGYDTWSADHTLALIIHPLLLKIKENKKGSPFVDPEDVPEDLQPKTEPNDGNHYVDDTHHERWDWVLDQMIFSFEKLASEGWEDEFYSGEHDVRLEDNEDGTSKLVYGPNDTFKVDREGINAVQNRIDAGLKLFGKYFQNLWD